MVSPNCSKIRYSSRKSISCRILALFEGLSHIDDAVIGETPEVTRLPNELPWLDALSLPKLLVHQTPNPDAATRCHCLRHSLGS